MKPMKTVVDCSLPLDDPNRVKVMELENPPEKPVEEISVVAIKQPPSLLERIEMLEAELKALKEKA